VLETNPAKYLQLATLTGKFTAHTPLEPQFHYFYNATHTAGDDPDALLVGLARRTPVGEEPPIGDNGWRSEGSYLPSEIPRTGGNTTEVAGAALFKEDKMVTEIDGDELMVLMMLRNSFYNSNLTLADPLQPDRMIAVNLHQQRSTRFNVDVSEPVPKISIEIALESFELGVQSESNFEDPRYRPILELAVSNKVRNDVVGLLQKTQQLDIDPAWIGEEAKIHFLTAQKWADYNWRQVYSQAPIDVTVKVDLRTFGLVRETDTSEY